MPGTGDLTAAAFGVHVGDLDGVVVRHDFLDVFDGELAVVRVQQVFEGFAGEFQRNRAVVEIGIDAATVERAFEFAHVRAQMLGDEEGNIVIQVDAVEGGFLFQDGDAHFQLGRLNLHGQPPVEAGNQARFQPLDVFGIGVAGDDDLLFRLGERVEDVEKGILRALLAVEKVDVVDD